MARLTISLLGAFRVLLDDVPITGFTSKKAQALLAYLVVEDRLHSREELAGLFWPEYPEPSARTSLRNALANVRSTIGDRHTASPYLVVTRQTIRFNSTSACVVDIKPFTMPAVTSVKTAPPIPQLVAALDCVQGSFLAGFSLADSPPFEEWLLLRREYFHRQIGAAFQRVTNDYEEQGEHAQALAMAQRWLNWDMWQEEAHLRVIKLLADTGQRSEALLHYERCRELLHTELGVEPADEITQLYQAIRTGQYRRRTEPLEVVSSPPRPFVQPLMPLVGREEERAALHKLLLDPDLRLVTVVGLGGIGKTHLAQVVAARCQAEFNDGAYLVEVAPLQTATAMVPAIAQALSFTFYDQAPPEEQLLDYLRHKQLLLLLDNLEHIPDCAELLLRLLKAAPDLKILATARVKLAIQGEQLFPLSGLTYPSKNNQDHDWARSQGASYGALELWRQNAVRLQPNFSLTQAVLPDVIRICRLLDGMPLGILLASAWLPMLSPREIADEIERNFAFLQSDDQGLLKRHQSMNAVFNHTWSLMSKEERRIFQQCAVFRGGFTLDAAQSVMDAPLPVLLALTGKFLLYRTEAGRFTLHELGRQFAAQKLDQAQKPGEESVQTDLHHRYSAFYLDFVQQRERDLKGARQQDAIGELTAEEKNIHAAWTRALTTHSIQQLRPAINGLGAFYEWQGRYQEGEAICRQAIQELDAPASAEEAYICARLYRWQARFNRLLGQHAVAHQLAQQSLKLLTDARFAAWDIRAEQAALWLELAQQSPILAEQIAFCEKALTCYRHLGDQSGTAQALFQRARAQVYPKNQYDGWQSMLEESLQLYQILGDEFNRATVATELGSQLMLMGQLEEGEQLLKESTAFWRRQNISSHIIRHLYPLGYGLLYAGKYTEAYQLGEEMLGLAQTLGNHAHSSASHRLLGTVDLHLGAYKQARKHCQLGQGFHDAPNLPTRTGFMAWQLGDIALAEGAYPEAIELYQQSIDLHQRTGMQDRYYGVLISLGHAAYITGRLDWAQHCLAAALPHQLTAHIWFGVICAMPLVALVALARGKAEQAVELYALAMRYEYIANAQWYHDVAGKYIAEAAASMPPARRNTAQARGQARDLWATVAELCDEWNLWRQTGIE